MTKEYTLPWTCDQQAKALKVIYYIILFVSISSFFYGIINNTTALDAVCTIFGVIITLICLVIGFSFQIIRLPSFKCKCDKDE